MQCATQPITGRGSLRVLRGMVALVVSNPFYGEPRAPAGHTVWRAFEFQVQLYRIRIRLCASEWTRRCTASHGGFGGHPRAVRPSPDMCSTIPYPQYARIIRQDDPMRPEPPFCSDVEIEFEFASGRTRRCTARHGGFGGHPRAVRPSPGMCSTIPQLDL